jgi:anti-sigma factor RsiW
MNRNETIPPISEEELHAFIDGELPPARAAEVSSIAAADPELAARIAAFRADKAALASLYGGIAKEPVPAAWLARIEAAAAPIPFPARRAAPPRSTWLMALAASVLLIIGGAVWLHPFGPPTDQILAQADAARQQTIAPATRIAGAALADATARDALLTRAVGLHVRAPDLARLGWRLGEIDTYAEAAALRYTNADGHALTLFVRKSPGAPRFDLLKNGAVRTCIWQDEVVSAVMMGDMSAGQMMRVASAAYNDLDL